MKQFKRIVIGLAVVAGLLALIPVFVSLDDYRVEIEKEVSTRLKEPVAIKSLRVSLLPLPHATIDSVTVGNKGDIRIGFIKIIPDIWSLAGTTKVVRSLEIGDVSLTQTGMEKAVLVLQSGERKTVAPEPSPVRLRHVQISNAVIQLEKLAIGPLDATIELAESGLPVEASVATRDGKLKGTLKPDKSKWTIAISGKAWKLPAGPAMTFDELKINATVSEQGAQLHQIDSRLYGGAVAGNATVGWVRGIQIRGGLEIKNVDIQSLLAAAGGKSALSGRLNASSRISGNAAKAVQLANVLRVEGPFSVQNGVLQGVDIQKAATNLLTKESGGQTHFDQLSGYLVAQSGAQQVTQLQVSSGVLAANGNVSVSARKELSGRLNAQVKVGRVAAAEVPLNVSGTVDSPVVLPTGATVAGAAVGTAILGPGVGTSVGAKIGGWAESLFGRKSEK